MVQVNENYYIRIEGKNLTLLKQIGLKRNGKPRYETIGYFGSFEPLFNTLLRRFVLDAVPSDELIKLVDLRDIIIAAREEIRQRLGELVIRA